MPSYHMTKASLLVFVQFILFSVLILTFIIFPVAIEFTPKVIGIMLIVVGLIIFIKALRAHSITNNRSPNITPRPNEQAALVHTGIYQKIRHPIYTGVMLCAMGAACFHGHPGCMITSLVFIPFFTYKSTYEESLLQQTYPQYRDYMQHTGRFILPLKLLYPSH